MAASLLPDFFYTVKSNLPIEPSDPLQLQTILLNRWKIIAKIGQGGHGHVYLAFDYELGRYVAIKVSKGGSRHLVNESFLLQEIGKHKHFPQVIYHQTIPLGFMVMDLVGPSLWDITERFRPLSLETISRIGTQMVDAVEHLHSLGYLHNDINPSNFAVGNPPIKHGTVFLLDLGTADKYVPLENLQNPPSDCVVKGTCTYVSQFVLNGEASCMRDDLYGILFTALSLRGQLPWYYLRNHAQIRNCMEENIHSDIETKLGEDFLAFKDYLDNLTYDNIPDYDRCRCYFQNLDRHSNCDMFEWMLDPAKLWQKMPPVYPVDTQCEVSLPDLPALNQHTYNFPTLYTLPNTVQYAQVINSYVPQQVQVMPQFPPTLYSGNNMSQQVRHGQVHGMTVPLQNSAFTTTAQHSLMVPLQSQYVPLQSQQWTPLIRPYFSHVRIPQLFNVPSQFAANQLTRPFQYAPQGFMFPSCDEQIRPMFPMNQNMYLQAPQGMVTDLAQDARSAAISESSHRSTPSQSSRDQD